MAVQRAGLCKHVWLLVYLFTLLNWGASLSFQVLTIGYGKKVSKRRRGRVGLLPVHVSASRPTSSIL